MRLRECFHGLRVDGRPKRIKTFAFTSVCVYNRLRVDVALTFKLSARYKRCDFLFLFERYVTHAIFQLLSNH